jgi:hypothetical protein
MREDKGLYQSSSGFYVLLVVVLQQIGCVDIISELSCVFALGVSSSFYQILQDMTVPEVSVILDGLYLILCCSFNKLQWWSGKVWSVLCCLVIGQ